MSNLEIIQSVYEAFGKGDIPAIMERLAPDVAWEQWDANSAQAAGVPWMAGGTGPGAAGAFFGVVGADFEIREFSVQNMMAGGNQVAVTFTMDATIRSTGGSFRDEEIHLWTLNDEGKIVALRHYSDTAKHIAAAGL